MITGNKGDWSEIYAFFKLLGDKQVFAGDANLKKIETFYPILKILRLEDSGEYDYSICEDMVIITKNDKEVSRRSVEEFRLQAVYLLKKISRARGSSFSIPEIEDFMHSVKCQSLKAKSKDKADIRIVIHDLKTQTDSLLGFSIKSQLGMPSTLFNASLCSNFTYKINGNLSEREIDEINSINSRSKIQDRVKHIIRKGASFQFVKTEDEVFYNNLIMIDSLLPQIIAEILLLFNSTGISELASLLEQIERMNPVKYNIHNGHRFYTYKLKRFLADIALGMTSKNVWDGKLDATGGYLVVKERGKVLCYHSYNKNDFEDYLLHNTNITNPSSTRNKFGRIYRKGNDLFFKMNLQIRFKQ